MYRGWHGVTDNKHILIAVSYEPVEGTLACRFVAGEPVIHLNVPENLYQILLRSSYAGSYYRKQIANKFPLLNPPEKKRFQSDDLRRAEEAKQAILGKKRLAESERPETNLFGEVIRGGSVNRAKKYTNPS